MQEFGGGIFGGTFFLALGGVLFVCLVVLVLDPDETMLNKMFYGFNLGGVAGIFLSIAGVMLAAPFAATTLVRFFGWTLVVSACVLALGVVAYAFVRVLEAGRR
jgi:hypothetical protein